MVGTPALLWHNEDELPLLHINNSSGATALPLWHMLLSIIQCCI